MVFTISKCISIGEEANVPNTTLRIWKEVLLSFIASLPFFTQGLQTASFSSSVHAAHFNPSPDDVPWSTTALIIAAGVSSPLYCYLIDKWGRRYGLFVVSLMQGASFIPMFLPWTQEDVIFLHIFGGITIGGLFTVVPIYIREISCNSWRALNLSFIMVMSSAGYMIRLLLDGENQMYVLVALVATQLVLMLVLAETPAFWVKRGKIEVAKASISKLLCLPEHSKFVDKELELLQQESLRARSKGELNFITILKNPIYRDATKIGISLYTVMILSGNIVFLNQEMALSQLKTDFDPAKTLVLSCMLAGCLVNFMLVKVLERRVLLTSSLAIMVLSIGVLSVYSQKDMTVATLRWVPVVALGVLVFAYGIAWGLPIVIMMEVLNFEIRPTMIGFIYTFSQIIKLAQVHSFKYVTDYMGVDTVLYIFAGVNMFGAVYTLFIVPDLRNKSVRQIERQLKRIPLLEFKNTPI